MPDSLVIDDQIIGFSPKQLNSGLETLQKDAQTAMRAIQSYKPINVVQEVKKLRPALHRELQVIENTEQKRDDDFLEKVTDAVNQLGSAVSLLHAAQKVTIATKPVKGITPAEATRINHEATDVALKLVETLAPTARKRGGFELDEADTTMPSGVLVGTVNPNLKDALVGALERIEKFSIGLDQKQQAKTYKQQVLKGRQLNNVPVDEVAEASEATVAGKGPPKMQPKQHRE
jgi:hypothetical protein